MNAPAKIAIPALSKRDDMKRNLHVLANLAKAAAAVVDERGDWLHTHRGTALVHAMYDVTEVDALYDLFGDLAYEFGLDKAEARILSLHGVGGVA